MELSISCIRDETITRLFVVSVQTVRVSVPQLVPCGPACSRSSRRRTDSLTSTTTALGRATRFQPTGAPRFPYISVTSPHNFRRTRIGMAESRMRNHSVLYYQRRKFGCGEAGICAIASDPGIGSNCCSGRFKKPAQDGQTARIWNDSRLHGGAFIT